MTEKTENTGTQETNTGTDAGQVEGTGTDTGKAEESGKSTGMDTEAVQAQLDALNGKKEEPKDDESKGSESEDESKDGKKPEDSEDKDNEDGEESKEPDLGEFGYDGLNEEQTAIAKVAMGANINFEQLNEAIVDGELDVTKLEGVDPNTALLLKSGVDAQIIKIKAKNQAIREEIHSTVGGEEPFKAMVDWARKSSVTNEAFQEEATTLFGMMKKGGLEGRMAAKELFSRFEADPNTSFKAAKDVKTETTEKKELTGRAKLDAGWADAQAKLNALNS